MKRRDACSPAPVIMAGRTTDAVNGDETRDPRSFSLPVRAVGARSPISASMFPKSPPVPAAFVIFCFSRETHESLRRHHVAANHGRPLARVGYAAGPGPCTRGQLDP